MGCGASAPVAAEPATGSRSPKAGSLRDHAAGLRQSTRRLFMKGLSTREASGLEKRMQDALKAIIEHRDQQADQSFAGSFNRIILKFPAIRSAFKSIKTVFDQYDVDNSGTIDQGELSECLRSLGSNLSEDVVHDMFHFAHMTQSTRKSEEKALSFKEFLLCLAIGSVLQVFPSMRAYSAVDITALVEEKDAYRSGRAGSVGARTPSERSIAPTLASDPAAPGADATGASSGDAGSLSRSSSGAPRPASAGEGLSQDGDLTKQQPGLSAQEIALRGKGQRLVKALKLVLEAYCLFDRDGSGTIDKDEVLAMVDEENQREKARRMGHLQRRNSSRSDNGMGSRSNSKSHGMASEAGPGISLLSRQRWEELDWDSDGQITFKEFLFAMMTWVGLDDDDSDDDTESRGTRATGAATPEATEAEDGLTIMTAEQALAASQQRSAVYGALEGHHAHSDPPAHLFKRESSRRVEHQPAPQLQGQGQPGHAGPVPHSHPPGHVAQPHSILKKGQSYAKEVQA